MSQSSVLTPIEIPVVGMTCASCVGRVEKAIAADPALLAQVDQHRALAASLRAAFEPVAAAPVPPGVETMLRDSAKVYAYIYAAVGRSGAACSAVSTTVRVEEAQTTCAVAIVSAFAG